MQAKRGGYKTYLIPKAVAYHKSSVSIKKINVFAYYCFQKSRFRFIVKNIELIFLPFALMINSVLALSSSYGSSVLKKNPFLFFFTLKALSESVFNAKNIRSI